MKSQVLNITGGFYTAVVVKFELFESRIIDERYFATREEAEAFQRVIIEKRFNDLENIACVVSRISGTGSRRSGSYTSIGRCKVDNMTLNLRA